MCCCHPEVITAVLAPRVSFRQRSFVRDTIGSSVWSCLMYGKSVCQLVRNQMVESLLCTGVGIKQVSSVKQMLGKLTTLDSNNYPEMLGKTCIINAPPGFGMIYGMVKPFLDARTRAKVEVSQPCVDFVRSHTDFVFLHCNAGMFHAD